MVMISSLASRTQVHTHHNYQFYSELDIFISVYNYDRHSSEPSNAGAFQSQSGEMVLMAAGSSLRER
jgi:hypothetical protein